MHKWRYWQESGDYCWECFTEIVPRTMHRNIGERAFSVATPRACNQLPTNLETLTCSTDSFKLFQNIFYVSLPTAVKHVFVDFCRSDCIGAQ